MSEPSQNEPSQNEPSLAGSSPAGSSPTGSSQNRQRLGIIIALGLVLVAAGAVYLLWASSRVSNDLANREERALASVDSFEAEQEAQAAAERERAGPTPTPVPTVVAAADAGFAPLPGEVLVVNRVPGDDYGRLAIRHVDGTRTLLDRTCLRVHIGGPNGVCLAQNETVLPTYSTTFFPTANPALEIKSYSSALPSRARISPTGSYSSVTAFATGSSYEDISSESTTIVTIDSIDGNERQRGAGQFEVTSTDERYSTFDAQYWGMTFAEDDQFYVTGFYGTDPEIMHGSLDDMAVEPTGWIGSCPSLSPDGKTLVFKELGPDGAFDLVAVDVATQEKWQLGEMDSVDDQVEWLDNDTILYARHPEGGDKPVQPEFDIWMLDIAPGSEPVLFLPNADSPAVAR